MRPAQSRQTGTGKFRRAVVVTHRQEITMNSSIVARRLPNHFDDGKHARLKGFLLCTLPRVVLGLIFLAGAIDGFTFIATGAHLVNPSTTPRGLQFQLALEAAGFFWPLMKSVELIGALCLLTNRAPALGLALLAPLMAVITLFHLVLNPQGLPLAAVLVLCGGLLLRAYADRFMPLLARGGEGLGSRR
jgi:hypothetical protein